MNDVTIHRHKDGSLAIEHAPEVFLCTRPSLELLVDNHNQAIAAGNDAKSEIARLAALVGTIRQYLRLPAKDFKDLTPEQHSHEIGDAIERLTTQLDEAGARLATLEADIKALLTETDPEAHTIDRLRAFTQRKIDFFRKHQELLKPRP